MASSAAEEVVVTGQDWIRGITYSVLASMIGAASKLSIRKSSKCLIIKIKKEVLHGYQDSCDLSNTPPSIWLSSQSGFSMREDSSNNHNMTKDVRLHMMRTTKLIARWIVTIIRKIITFLQWKLRLTLRFQIRTNKHTSSFSTFLILYWYATVTASQRTIRNQPNN